MKNKGFTLIELLAVIVILAVIALITPPMILGVIDTAKRGSAELAAFGYVEAVEKSIMTKQVTGTVTVEADTTYYVVSGGLSETKGGAVVITVDAKGDIPSTDSTIIFKNTSGEVKRASLTFANIKADYTVYYESGAKNNSK